MTWSRSKPAHTYTLVDSATHTSSGRIQPVSAVKATFRCTNQVFKFDSGERTKETKTSLRTSVQGSCREEVQLWVWEPSRWLISTWWWVSGSRRRSLQVVSGLVLWLSGGEVVLQEGLDVFESGPLVWLLLPAEMHHFVQRLRAALRTRHPVAPLHLLQHLSVHHAWKTVDTESVCLCKRPLFSGQTVSDRMWGVCNYSGHLAWNPQRMGASRTEGTDSLVLRESTGSVNQWVDCIQELSQRKNSLCMRETQWPFWAKPTFIYTCLHNDNNKSYVC